MKTKLPFKTTLQIAMWGKTVTKILTVFLCAFSFALFTLASTGYAYDKTDFLARAQLNLDKELTYVKSVYFPILDDGRTREDYVKEVEEAMGIDFAYFYIGNATKSEGYYDLTFDEDDFYNYDMLYAQNYLYYFYYDYYFQTIDGEPVKEEFDWTTVAPSETLGQGNAMSASADLYRQLGFQPVYGRYPERYNEVAITVDQFIAFQNLGYVDNTLNYMHMENGIFDDGTDFYNPRTGEYAYYADEKTKTPYYHIPVDGTGYFFFHHMTPKERVEIETFEDLAAIEFPVYGNPEQGVIDQCSMFPVKIVGVLDATRGYGTGMQMQPVIFYSEEWHDMFVQEECCDYMLGEGISDYDTAYNSVLLSEKYREELIQTRKLDSHWDEYYADYGTDISITNTDGLLNNVPMGHSNYMKGENLIIWYGTAAGAGLGIFAVLLCGYLMSSSLTLKKRNYGVLRSVGAGEADITRIILTEALIVSLAIFLLGLVFTLVGYYGFLGPLLYYEKWKISVLQLNGWNILILLALSFLTPLLCTIVPLIKFLKKPIVDNITGNSRRR